MPRPEEEPRFWSVEDLSREGQDPDRRQERVKRNSEVYRLFIEAELAKDGYTLEEVLTPTRGRPTPERKRQREALARIVHHLLRRLSFPPTLEEIGEALGGTWVHPEVIRRLGQIGRALAAAEAVEPSKGEEHAEALHCEKHLTFLSDCPACERCFEAAYEEAVATEGRDAARARYGEYMFQGDNEHDDEDGLGDEPDPLDDYTDGDPFGELEAAK
jgi:hypothetical protein